MAAPEAAQDKRGKAHGSPESCHERWELLKEELPGAQPQARLLPQQEAGVQGASQPRQGPNTGQGEKKKTKPYTRPPILRAARTNNEWQCANCGQTNWMTRKECRQCHKMPPGPSNPVPLKETATGSTGHPHTTWADVAKGKSDQRSDKNMQQSGKALPSPEVPVKDGDTNTQDSQVAHYERAIAAPPEGCKLRDNLKAPMMALKVTLPPETRPGVRVDQATARLTRAQKLKAELEEKLLEVEQAVQDNLTEIAAATAELENAKRALIPSAPTTDPGSACITFSREQSAELQGFLLSCQKSLATDPEEKERAKRRCNESHEAAGVTQEAAQEEVDTANKLAKLTGWAGEKLPPQAPADSSVDATVKDATLPETDLPRGQVPPGGLPASQNSAASSQASAQGFSGLQGGNTTPT